MRWLANIFLTIYRYKYFQVHVRRRRVGGARAGAKGGHLAGLPARHAGHGERDNEITTSSALSQAHCAGDLGAPVDWGGGYRRPHRDCARPPGPAASVLQEGVPVVTTIPGYWQHVWLKNN